LLSESERLITHDGIYTISAPELQHPKHPQLLQIIVPGAYDYESMYIDYRTEGGDLPNVLIDGTPAPLHPYFTGGASIRKSLTEEIWSTEHFETLRDGLIFTFPDYYPQYDIFTVEQLSSTPDEVRVYIKFKDAPDDESWLNPEQCSDGINNDNDFSCDYNGCDDLPPQKSCVFPWSYMIGTSSMRVGDQFDFKCSTPETKSFAGFGPMGEDVGPISSSLTLNGREYVATFAPTQCKTYTVSCTTNIEGAYTEGLSEEVTVTCRPGYTCSEDNECVPVRVRRPSGRVGRP
jgi:hypothetical protein